MNEPLALPTTPFPLRVRLFLMMFLQYFIQGCYLPVASLYLEKGLKFDQEQVGNFNSAMAIGPLLALFIIGQLVDRHFATQVVLAVCHLAAALLMFGLYTQVSYWPVMALGTIYSILYVPTMMLTNSLAFAHLNHRDREFPIVRVWGTIGFILPAWLIEYFWLSGLQGDAQSQARAVIFLVSAAAGVAMAIYCLTLPNTPPTKSDKRTFAPRAAVSLLSQRNFLVLMAVSFFVAMVHMGFLAWNSRFLASVLRRSSIEGSWEARIASLGQIAEIAVMFLLSLFVLRLGFKRTMILGAAAYALRCLLLALAATIDPPWALRVACVAQTLHGFCFGCFLATAFMYVDRVSPHDLRGSMQNIYGTFVLGLGFVLGGWAAGKVDKALSVGDANNWTANWLASAGLAAACTIAFAAFFPRDATRAPPPG